MSKLIIKIVVIPHSCTERSRSVMRNLHKMKKIVFILFALSTFLGYAQKKDKALIASNNYVYEGNELVNEDFSLAEMEYRKAISEKPTNVVGAYNLGNAYYKNQKFSEAVLRHQEVIKTATSKAEKHKAYHNIGNALMQEKKCKEAVEAFKSALRNNPNDDETRYNLGLAKKCSEEQGGGSGEDDNQDEDQEKQDKEQEKEDNNEKKDEGDENKENNEEGDEDEDKKDGEDKEDEDGKPKDENKDEGKGEDQKKEQPKPQQGQLSPQQIKNLLEAMNDQEQKVQEKINAQKAKGVKVQNDKDW